MNQKKASPKKVIGLILLTALLIAAVILGIRVASLVDMTYTEINATPTPEPLAGNVMLVTIDPNAPTPEPVLRTGSQGNLVKDVQARLQTLGYYEGSIDGQFGSGTRDAVLVFQRQHSLEADGIVGEETRQMLFSAQARVNITPAPVTATPTVRPSGSTPWVMANGMPLLVNRDTPLPEDYQPADLVLMADYCDSSLVKIKGSETEGERVAVDALMAMLQAAHHDGLDVWQISAGYRTVKYQQKLFDDQVKEYMNKNGLSKSKATSAARKTVADPGTSEHHTGLAFDVTVPGQFFKDTKQAKWLAENCWDYGFVIRYTKEKESITGFLAEPWHIRYVGTEHSLAMRDEGLCLEEYIAHYGSV